MSDVSKIRATLRWFTSASDLINRPDRAAALLERFAGVAARLEDAERAYQRVLDANLEPAVLAPIESNYDRIFELADNITEAVRLLQASAPRTPASGTRPTPPAVLGRLPSLDLPSFGGALGAWVGYKNLFDSLVHSREDLSASQKLAYLLSSLSGEARDLIRHLAVTDENYEPARELLRQRYDSVRRLADTHIAEILDLPPVTRATSLRASVLNPLQVSVNALKTLGLPVDKWSFLLLHIVLKKLTPELRLRFEQLHGGKSPDYLPPFDSLLQFLEDECRTADNSVSVVTPPTQLRGERPQGPLRPAPPSPGGRASPRAGRPRFAAAESGSACIYCRATGHRVTFCRSFADKRVQARRAIAKERQWCYTCLSKHFQRDCPVPTPCRYCQGKHHPLLCANRPGAGTPPVETSLEPLDWSAPVQSSSSPRGGGSPIDKDCSRGGGSPGGRRSPPRGGSPRGGDSPKATRQSSPRRIDLAVASGSHSEAPSFSPPLRGSTGLERRPPGFTRMHRQYEAPPMATMRRPPVTEDWAPLPRFDTPTQGTRGSHRHDTSP